MVVKLRWGSAQQACPFLTNEELIPLYPNYSSTSLAAAMMAVVRCHFSLPTFGPVGFDLIKQASTP